MRCRLQHTCSSFAETIDVNPIKNATLKLKYMVKKIRNKKLLERFVYDKYFSFGIAINNSFFSMAFGTAAHVKTIPFFATIHISAINYYVNLCQTNRIFFFNHDFFSLNFFFRFLI